MNFIKHPEHSFFIGKPLDWDESVHGPCGALSVHEFVHSGIRTMESAWDFTVAEAISFAAGTTQLRLGVMAPVHPVVYMCVMPMPPEDKAEIERRLRSAHVQLLSLADFHGVKL